jgi:hypothetical protein
MGYVWKVWVFGESKREWKAKMYDIGTGLSQRNTHIERGVIERKYGTGLAVV